MKRLHRELQSHSPTPGKEVLRAFLCGGQRITTRDDTEIKITSARGRAIIAVLCLTPDGRMKRLELAQLLWPEPPVTQSSEDDDEPVASAKDDKRLGNLREELKKLRREFGGFNRFLHVDREFLRLDLTAIWTDHRAYLISIIEGQAPPTYMCGNTRLLLAGQRILTPAFGAWLDAKRLEFNEFCRRALLHRTAICESQELPLVQRIAEHRKLFDFDSSDEEACRKLMTLLIRGGHYGAARDAYLRCEQAVLRRTDCPPEPLTRQLHARALKCLQDDQTDTDDDDADEMVVRRSRPLARMITDVALAKHDEGILVGIRPIANLTGDPALDRLAQIISAEMLIDLPLLLRPFRILPLPARSGLPERGNGCHFVVDVSLLGDPGRADTSLRLNMQIAARGDGRLVNPSRTTIEATPALEDPRMVSSRLAGKILVSLLLDTSETLAPFPIEALTDSELVALGMSRLARSNTPENLAEAEFYFRSARKRNRKNVDALAGLAHVHHRFASQPSFSSTPQIALMRGKAYAEAALEIDKNHTKANYVAAMLCSTSGRPEIAAGIFDHLLSMTLLAPALGYSGYNRVFIGKADLGRRDIQRSISGLRDDASMPIWLMFEGTAAFHCGDLDGAITCYEGSINLDPRYGSSRLMLAGMLDIAGKRQAAQAHMETFRSQHPTYRMRDFDATWGRQRTNNVTYLERTRHIAASLEALELPQA